MSSYLSQAIDAWQAGRPVPRNVAAALIEEGYDLPSLSRFHSKASNGSRKAPLLPEVHYP